jgi:hypothetical protein
VVLCAGSKGVKCLKLTGSVVQGVTAAGVLQVLAAHTALRKMEIRMVPTEEERGGEGVALARSSCSQACSAVVQCRRPKHVANMQTGCILHSWTGTLTTSAEPSLVSIASRWSDLHCRPAS